MTIDEAHRMAAKHLWLCVREEWQKVVLGIGVIAVVIAAAASAPAAREPAAVAEIPFKGAEVMHDDARQVTCWVWSHPKHKEGGISCVPDWLLVKPEGEPKANIRGVSL